MTLLKLVRAFVARRPLTWGFHVLTLALGVAVVTSLILLNQSVEQRFSRDLANVDLVVGAKGSPLQLVLSALFQMDTPTGNIPLADAERLSRNRMVRFAVPVSMGDNVGGVRIVGTSLRYAELYDAHVAQGRWWARPMEAVLGSQAARRLNLRVGQSFVGEHGLTAGGEAHAATPYRVVGVLAPTGAVADRLVLTDTASVWEVHARHDHHDGDADDDGDEPHEREVTALLVKYRSAMGNLLLPRLVNAVPNLQAASPAIEVTRLIQLVGVGAGVLRAFGLGLLALSAIGFFVALFGAVSQRRRELALLRALGARPRLLVAAVLVEGLALGLAGGVLGVALARLAVWSAVLATERSSGPALAAPGFGPVELAAIAVAALLSVLAALGPGLVASRVDAAQVLKGA